MSSEPGSYRVTASWADQLLLVERSPARMIRLVSATSRTEWKTEFPRSNSNPTNKAGRGTPHGHLRGGQHALRRHARDVVYDLHPAARNVRRGAAVPRRAQPSAR